MKEPLPQEQEDEDEDLYGKKNNYRRVAAALEQLKKRVNQAEEQDENIWLSK